MFQRFFTIVSLTLVFAMPDEYAIATGYCSQDSTDLFTKDKTARNEADELIYICYAGKRRIKTLKKSVPVIEAYRLPFKVVSKIIKLQKPGHGYVPRLAAKQKKILDSWQNACITYIIQDNSRYKSFYPKGLKKGDYLSANEFNQWDFCKLPETEIIEKKQKTMHDSLLRVEDLANLDSPPETVPVSDTLPKYTLQTSLFRPWDLTGSEINRKPYDPSFDTFIDSLFRNFTKLSSCLGAQRILIELYDQPLAGAFYATMYTHYVDSITAIMKDGHNVKPDEIVRFISEVSQIIPNRFPYGINHELWRGIRRNRMDCDNTAFLVYDIGTKLGFIVNLVVVYGHALVIIGDYAYETTEDRYYPKESVGSKYGTIYLNTSDPKKVHAQLTCWSSAFQWIEDGDYEKARALLKTGLRALPDNPLMMMTLGDIYSSLNKHDKALDCYLTLLLKKKDDPVLISKINYEKVYLSRHKE